MVDRDPNRLELAKSFGVTAIVNSVDGKEVEVINAMTDGRGVDVAIEAVGTPSAFDTCQNIVGPGGTIANIGVHGTKVDLHLERLWNRNITLTTRLVDTASTPMLLETLQSGKLEPKRLVTHRFDLAHITDAYATFGDAAKTRALKVFITAS